MKIVTTIDDEFDYKSCKNLYNVNSIYMGNTCSFKDIIRYSHFYSFYENEKLLGCIYITKEHEKLFINGFSIRKNHQNNIKAVKKVLSFYNCPIFAKTKNKTAIYLLKKCGFNVITSYFGLTYLKKEI